MFVVRTSKPVENLWKNGLFWSRYSFVTHSIDLKPRDWGLGTFCLGRPSGDGLRSPFGRRAVPVWFSHTDKKIIYFMKPNDNQMSFTCDLPQLTAHLCSKLLTYVRKSRTVLDSTLFRILDFQFLLVELGFRIPWAVFRTARPRIPDSFSKFSWIRDSRIQIPLQGAKNGLLTSFLYYIRTTSLHVQRTFQLTSEYHYWRMLQIHLASSDPRVSKSTY